MNNGRTEEPPDLDPSVKRSRMKSNIYMKFFLGVDLRVDENTPLLSFTQWTLENANYNAALIREGKLDQRGILEYLDYTAYIAELACRYAWESVFACDYDYREKQEEFQWRWGDHKEEIFQHLDTQSTKHAGQKFTTTHTTDTICNEADAPPNDSKTKGQFDVVGTLIAEAGSSAGRGIEMPETFIELHSSPVNHDMQVVPRGASVPNNSECNGEDVGGKPLSHPRTDDSSQSMARYALDAGDFLNKGPHIMRTSKTKDDDESTSNADMQSGLPNAVPFKGYEVHMDGAGDKQKAAEVQAPVRSELGQIQRKALGMTKNDALKLTKTVPRNYQVELFWKTMEGDRVIFLPTGTGKTLVSIMTMSCMLTLNPRRPVMFLVDEVLLVLQQSKVIQKELGDREYQRLPLDGENPNLTTRRLKIATLCGNILPADSTPLYRHDIVVTTAAYADNLLDKQWLHWKDFSLVVFDEAHHCVMFDEAHHCVNKHSFNHLRSTYHCPCAPEHRPKVLGLTASPARRESVESTLIMLMGLCERLGGATVAIVQGKMAQKKLRKYQSNAKPLINYKPYSEEEMAFRKKLREYLCLCYQKLATLSDLEAECSWNGKMTRNLSEFAEGLDGAAIESLNVLGSLKLKSNSPAIQSNAHFLQNLLKDVIISVMDMDSLGIPSAIGDLQLLSNPDSCFNFAKTLGIPCADLEDAVKRIYHSVSVQNEFQDNPNRFTLYTQLLETLTNPTYIDWAKGREPMALILVRERTHANTLSNFLKQSKLVADHDLKVLEVLEQDSDLANGGVMARTQKLLEKISEEPKKKYIIVATSVAEECVDIPECELIVCINPPSTVTGLVQMRGRVRKKDSFFVILCKSQDEKDKMEGLLMRERNMMEATKLCVEKQRRTFQNGKMKGVCSE